MHQLLFDSLVFLEPVAVLLDADHLTVVHEPIKDGSGDSIEFTVFMFTNYTPLLKLVSASYHSFSAL